MEAKGFQTRIGQKITFDVFPNPDKGTLPNVIRVKFDGTDGTRFSIVIADEDFELFCLIGKQMFESLKTGKAPTVQDLIKAYIKSDVELTSIFSNEKVDKAIEIAIEDVLGKKKSKSKEDV